jgi:hypothetical protein
MTAVRRNILLSAAAVCALCVGPAMAATATPDNAMLAAVADGFGSDPAGEDRFDSVLGVLCVLNVLAGNRPDTAPPDPWIQRWEGWVLGQTAMPVMATAPPAAGS